MLLQSRLSNRAFVVFLLYMNNLADSLSCWSYIALVQAIDLPTYKLRLTYKRRTHKGDARGQ